MAVLFLRRLEIMISIWVRKPSKNFIQERQFFRRSSNSRPTGLFIFLSFVFFSFWRLNYKALDSFFFTNCHYSHHISQTKHTSKDFIKPRVRNLYVAVVESVEVHHLLLHGWWWVCDMKIRVLWSKGEVQVRCSWILPFW